MDLTEIRLEKFFQEFQSSFNAASSEEKKRLLTLINPWIEQQMISLGNLPTFHPINPTPTGKKHPKGFQSGQLKSNASPYFHSKPLQNLDERGIDLSQITESIEQVFWVRDIQSNRILYISPAFETIWGRSCESVYADPSILIESVHPEDRVQVMAASTQIIRKPINQAYRILRPDGSLRWINVHTFLIRDKVGESFNSFCIAQEITDQKQVEQALRKTLDRTREQFDLSHKMSLARKPEAVLKTLMSANELHSAQRATLLFFENPQIGPSRGLEVTARWLSSQTLPPWTTELNLYEDPTFWKIFQPNRTVVITGIQFDPRLSPLVRDYLQSGEVLTLVIFPLIASGVWLGCLLVFYSQEHPFNHIELRHLKVLVDQATITLFNLRLLEVEAESRHEAERANEIKTEFLAMISHELRTPLTSIVGFTTTLLADDVSWEPEEQNDFIQTIQQEANRLQELIDHLLDLSRMEAGMLPITQGSYSLQGIIQDALPQLHTLTEGKVLTMHLPAILPFVYVDAKRIAQILVNLVRNAATYSPPGSEISLESMAHGEFVQINVSDQGPGIPPSEHRKVFKAFQRGKNIEYGQSQGAGLGLAICKGLVEAHGGRIWIKKKASPGTTICFTLPVVHEKAPAQLALEEK